MDDFEWNHQLYRPEAVGQVLLPSRHFDSDTIYLVSDMVESLRKEGIPCYHTMDAGPNVKILCLPQNSNTIIEKITPLTKQLHVLKVGKDAHLT